VNRQIAIRAVQFRLVIARLIHPRLKVVRDDKTARSLEELEGSHMRVDPVPEVLRPGGFGVGVVAGAQHRYEHLGLANFAGLRINHRYRLPGVIHERLFPGAVLMPQHHVQPMMPVTVTFAVPTVGVTLRIGLLVFLPQQLKCDILPALQLFVDDREVGQRAMLRRHHRRRRKQAPLKRYVITIDRQRPTQPR
jgi:hypothetical protein